MKKIVLFAFLSLIVFSCTKRLEVNQDKYFEQTNWSGDNSAAGTPGWIGSGPMHLELRTDGRAFLYPGSGDIVYSGTYKIRGKKLKVNINDFSLSYDFLIISGTELKGSGGEMLKLKER